MGIFANRRRVPPGRLRYLALVALVISWGSQAIGGQTTTAGPKKTEWKLPRTADGQPDLQGVWNYGQETPLQRPAEFAGKDHVTPEEAARYDEQMAARRKARANGAPNRYSGEVFDDVLAKADWTKRTSLITDPPDGKMPPVTPLAEARRADSQGEVCHPARARGHRVGGPVHPWLALRAADHSGEPEQRAPAVPVTPMNS